MTDDILHGPLVGKIFRFALPAAFTIICEQLVNNTDVVLLGKYVGDSAMAAVGNDTPVVSLLISLLVGLSLGANVIMAQALGGKKKEAAGRILHTAFLFSVLVGLAFTAIGEILTSPLLSLMGVPEEVAGEASLYLRIYLLALPFLSLYNFEAALFRAWGDSRAPLYALALSALVNGALDLLAGTSGWGLAGIVWATVFAYALDGAVLFFMLLRKEEIPFSIHQVSLDGPSLQGIVKIGLPAGLQGMVFAVSNLIIQSALNSLGPEVMAASSAAFVIEINVYAFVNGFGQAATTFVGQNFGAGNLKRCFQVTRKTLMAGCSFIIILSLAIDLLAGPILELFSRNPEIIDNGILRIYAVTSFQVLNEVIEILSGSLRGYGYSLPPALVTFVSICGVRILWVFTAFAAAPSFCRLLICYPLSWLVTVVLLIFVYRSIKKTISRSYAGRMGEVRPVK